MAALEALGYIPYKRNKWRKAMEEDAMGFTT